MLALVVMQLLSDSQTFKKCSHALLYYTLLVVLWGAWVRISHSGDGCGDTWPLCHGQILPDAEHGKTWVELSHRLTSGLFGLLVIFLYLRARSIFQKDHPARGWAFWTLFFTITEALLGAKLVLFGLVGSDSSAFRMFAMILHLLNSMTLVACITMLVETSQKESLRLRLGLTHWGRRLSRIFIVSFLALAATGAVAALSTTLFPSQSLVEGLQNDLARDSHWLLRLRVSHPTLGILLGGGLALALWLMLQSMESPTELLRRRTKILMALISSNVVFGLVTLLQLSPIWMKLGHLLLGYLTWIALVRWLIPLKSVSFNSKT